MRQRGRDGKIIPRLSGTHVRNVAESSCGDDAYDGDGQ